MSSSASLVSTPPMPAEGVRLRPSFDAGRLLRELTSVREHTWDQQRVYTEDGVGAATAVDWRCLALRSPGGDGDRTDPGGPGPRDFADTVWLDRIPYVREVLDSIPAPLHAVRFMALGPDTVGIDHTDPKYGPRWGVGRLHVPVVTNPGAVLVLDGVEHRWQPGEFWFGDFSRLHRVQNTGTEARVHLVIDVLVTPGLASLFPDGWQEYFRGGEVLYNRQQCPQTADERRRLNTRFPVPATFHLWEDDTPLSAAPPQITATLAEDGDRMTLRLPGDRVFALVHLGDNEYRLAGWSEERTLQVFPDGPDPKVVLRTREGSQVKELTVSAERLAA
ncbi:aspartyl/asparaginyl beta-hydroxylase domain-containing protein [Streptomyces longwoodensis]|uniref:aspartyl/asparaginyl beta-hydroxylase domain-containing protein n=1 Tax=Streptomyces longwoodensis TaxID=68231 RepID=UPI002E804E73|nr:aspartyl/asparaginyl beta-hydroxylase domain-containing protein [Streptomyces longwoodensis]WTI49254.1 aspartyl/asparaginyl beta-hydroxylase domain-containing protein [Streptomyces longwoodensis]WUC61954.1 aspartyl/asparaginyl beta-hydroxylase domain-containing protein [Streptomyces longwoodensis]